MQQESTNADTPPTTVLQVSRHLCVSICKQLLQHKPPAMLLQQLPSVLHQPLVHALLQHRAAGACLKRSQITGKAQHPLAARLQKLQCCSFAASCLPSAA